MISLFNVLVRNRLEYCSSVWSPFYVNAIEQIERVQRKYTRMFYYKFKLGYPRPDYHSRLKRMKLHTLESRRIENDEIFLYKLIHNLVDSSLKHGLTFHRPQRVTRQAPQFYLPTMSTNYQHNSPIFRLQRNHDTYFSDVNLHEDKVMTFKNEIRNFFEF